MFSTINLWQEGPGFGQPSMAVCIELACSLCASMGFLRFHPQSKDMRIRQTGYSKLPLGVYKSMNGCSVQGALRLAPKAYWDWL